MITLRYVNYICTMNQRGRKTAKENKVNREGGSGRQTDRQAGGYCNLLSRALLTAATVVVADHC